MYTYPSPTRTPFTLICWHPAIQTFQTSQMLNVSSINPKAPFPHGTLQKNGRALPANYISLRLFVVPQK